MLTQFIRHRSEMVVNTWLVMLIREFILPKLEDRVRRNFFFQIGLTWNAAQRPWSGQGELTERKRSSCCRSWITTMKGYVFSDRCVQWTKATKAANPSAVPKKSFRRHLLDLFSTLVDIDVRNWKNTVHRKWFCNYFLCSQDIEKIGYNTREKV